MEYSGYEQKYEAGGITLYQADCMKMLPQIPDKYYNLCICDPPYGIGECGGDKQRGRKANNYNKIVIHKKKEWDKQRPSSEYFKELFRVSKNQIIWGGNYFTDFLYPSMGWIFWNKLIGGDFSDGELAWTSFSKALRQFTYSYHGDTHGGHSRIHPTQKPVKLYEWLLKNYAKPGDRILDTHGGSMSSAIACYNLDFDLTLFEIDPEYFEAGKSRLEEHKKQLRMFNYEKNLDKR